MSLRLCVAALRGGPLRMRPAPGLVGRRPSPRRTARLFLTGGEHSELDGRFLDALVAAVPEIERALADVKAFTVIVREQDQAGFGAWLNRCRDGPPSGLAEGLRRDRAAVEAALALSWSTSTVEGQINRVKTLKRTMYGRAKLDLPRARVRAA